MASPFTIFRKYSGGLMVVMVILSMLLFTLTDLFMDPQANLWLLGMLVGGTIFAIAGIGQGRWLQWGAGGAVLGAVLGFVMPMLVDQGGLETSIGRISEEEMYDLELRRNVANQFIIRATEASFGEGMGRFARLFGFGHGPREDVVFGRLLRAEADRLGITVSTDMVTEYLKKITAEKLTREDYIRIRNELAYKNQSLNDDLLLSILADELKAQMAYMLLRPEGAVFPPAPEVFWEYYKRLNVREQIEIAALDVDDFLDQIEDPSDAEIEATFAKYAKKFPNQDEPGAPGFRLPFRARLAWLEIDAQSIEQSIGDVTEEDIQKYYEENKDTPLIRRPVTEDTPDKKEPAEPQVPPTGTKPADEGSDKETGGDDKQTETKEPSATNEPAPADRSDAKESSPQGENKDATGSSPESGSPKSDAAPAAEEKTSSTEANDQDAPAEESSSSEGDDSCGLLPLDEDPKADESNENGGSDNQPPAEEKPAGDAADDKPADKRPDAPAEPAKPAEPAATEKPLTDSPQPAEAAPPSLTIPALEEPAGEKDMEIKYEYRPLDDQLKQEIRNEIIRQRVQQAIEEKIRLARTQMETLASQRSRHRFALIEENPKRFEGSPEEKEKAIQELRESMREFDQQLLEQLKEWASKNGFVYVESPLVSYNDLLGEDYPIGRATAPDDNPMRAAQSPTVAQTIFEAFSNDIQNNEAQLFQPRVARRMSESLDGNTWHYVYWVFDYSPSHVPDLNEEGVREAVINAIKRMKAREIVEQRGKALVELVRKALAEKSEEPVSMAKVLEGETATGDENGPALAVRISRPFSWYRSSTVSPMSFQQPTVSMSQIEFDDGGGPLEKIGPDFMKAIFDDLDDGDVGVVPNFDKTKFYVVRVINRFPTPELGMDGLRERFLNEGRQFAFAQSPVVSAMRQDVIGPTSLEWEKKLWKKYGIDPDAEPEE